MPVSAVMRATHTKVISINPTVRIAIGQSRPRATRMATTAATASSPTRQAQMV